MSKGSGTTKGVDKTHTSYSKISNKDIDELNSIDEAWYGPKNRKVSEILQKLGHSENDIKTTFSLLEGHIKGLSEQDLADEKLSISIENNDSISKVLQDIDAISRKSLIRSGKIDMTVWRGGDEVNVESWTTKKRGVDTPVGHIYPDRHSSIKELSKTHYIVQGVANQQNYYGESEITFIRKKSTLSAFKKQYERKYREQ
jgi:hypothetical protein